MKVKKSIGEPYDSKYEWPCSCQCGGEGVVFSNDGAYRTAFFEAFPNEPKCFLRGEGKTIEEAEEQCWSKYQKVLSCTHEMERRDRTDGYAFCKHCSYSSTVFEPLTRCCKCGIPTAHSKCFRGKWYCKKHSVNKPKSKGKRTLWSERVDNENRLPRKQKKAIKIHAGYRFNTELNYTDKVRFSMKYGSIRLYCKDKLIQLLFKRQRLSILKLKKF